MSVKKYKKWPKAIRDLDKWTYLDNSNAIEGSFDDGGGLVHLRRGYLHSEIRFGMNFHDSKESFYFICGFRIKV